MQFTIFATSLLAAAGISAASPIEARQTPPPVVTQGDYIWKISDFTARKLNGVDISSLSFNIKATNGGTLDFICSASGNITANNFYECGLTIQFTYQDDRNGLLLRQDVSDEYVITIFG